MGEVFIFFCLLVYFLKGAIKRDPKGFLGERRELGGSSVVGNGLLRVFADAPGHPSQLLP